MDLDVFNVAVSKIKTFLMDERSVVLREENGRVWVEGHPEGFRVELIRTGEGITLAAGGWHDEYTDGSEAADLFMWLLTPKARIVADAYGESEYAWTFEMDDEKGWTAVSKMSLVVPRPFWRKKRKVARSNHLIGA